MLVATTTQTMWSMHPYATTTISTISVATTSDQLGRATEHHLATPCAPLHPHTDPHRHKHVPLHPHTDRATILVVPSGPKTDRVTILVVPSDPKTDRATMLVVPNGPKTNRIMFKVAPPNQTTVPRATVVEAYRDTDADSRHLRDMRAKTHHNIQLILKQTDFSTRIDNNYSINSTCVAIQSCNAVISKFKPTNFS